MPAVRTRAKPAGDFDYEADGGGYASLRCSDPRSALIVHAALGEADTIINVGAGAGSYEPLDRYVVPVEPSASMRSQRPPHLRPALDATAEALPFNDDAFDAAMATVTVHQRTDPDAGLREMRRVSTGPVVVLTFDARALTQCWICEYFPEVTEVGQRPCPSIEHIAAVLGGTVQIEPVPIPADCVDGSGEAYYARPETFVDPDV